MVSRSRPSTRSPLLQDLLPHDPVLDLLEHRRRSPGPPRGSSAAAARATSLLAPPSTPGARLALSLALMRLWPSRLRPAPAPRRAAPRSGSALVHSIFWRRPGLLDQLFWSPMSSLIPLWATFSASRSRLRRSRAAALDHHDRVGRAADDQVDVAELELLEGRVQNPVSLDPPTRTRGDRTVPGHRREAERERGGDDAEDVGIVLLVGGEHVTKTCTSFLKPSGKAAGSSGRSGGRRGSPCPTAAPRA